MEPAAHRGPAEQIAAGVLPSSPPAVPLLARTWLPWAVVALMVLGFVGPFGWLAMLAGLGLFAASPLWNRRWKVGGAVAYVVALLAPWGVAALTTKATPASETPSVLMPGALDLIWVVLLVPLGWTVVSVALAWRATARPARGPR